MKRTIALDNLYTHETDAYNLEGFEPRIVDAAYLKELGVTIEPSEQTLKGLEHGSKVFIERMKRRTVIPVSRLVVEDCNPDDIRTEIHNYTGRCPTLTFEINPVRGCNVGCQYCLVTDGVHEQTLTAYENYHLYVRKLLEDDVADSVRVDAAASAAGPGRIEDADLGEVDDRRRERERVRRRAGRGPQAKLEGRVVVVGRRADEAVVDAGADVVGRQPGREEDVRLHGRDARATSAARPHGRDARATSAGGFPVVAAHAVGLPEEAVV